MSLQIKGGLSKGVVDVVPAQFELELVGWVIFPGLDLICSNNAALY